MAEMLTPEIRAKIIKLRKEGKSFIQIEDELKLKRGALSHIGQRGWFVAAMKEKGEDGKTGYRLFSQARKANLKSRRQARDEAREEKEKEKEKERTSQGGDKKVAGKEDIDTEVESHLEGSDKDQRRRKKKKETGGGGGDGDKTKPGKGKKGKGSLLIVLILIIAAVLIIALFMIFGRKEKGKEPGEEEGKEAGEYQGRPFDNM